MKPTCIQNTNKALLLDRDGVINADFNYVYKSEQIEFIDGIFELCRRAFKKKYLIIVITNQSGIGRGYFSERTFLHLSKWMREVFHKQKCPITKIFYSPYHAEHGIGKYKRVSNFRKPSPGMIQKAEKRYCLNLDKSILIGDKKWDIEAGLSAGVGKNLLLDYNKSIKLNDEDFHVIKNLYEAISFLE